MSDHRFDRAEGVESLRHHLLQWGKEHIRNYPWRHVNSSYRILVSEFMLHRTQVAQVTTVYRQFVDTWPSLKAWGQSEHTPVHQMLKPLGLSWRTSAMVAALDYLWSEYGEVPMDPQRLQSIHGIGPYIANATICFACNRPMVLVDTNTVRVIGRVFGMDLTGEARRKKTIINTIRESVDPDDPRGFYYALIDLAHDLCLPSQPRCIQCPLPLCVWKQSSMDIPE